MTTNERTMCGFLIYSDTKKKLKELAKDSIYKGEYQPLMNDILKDAIEDKKFLTKIMKRKQKNETK